MPNQSQAAHVLLRWRLGAAASAYHRVHRAAFFAQVRSLFLLGTTCEQQQQQQASRRLQGYRGISRVRALCKLAKSESRRARAGRAPGAICNDQFHLAVLLHIRACMRMHARRTSAWDGEVHAWPSSRRQLPFDLVTPCRCSSARLDSQRERAAAAAAAAVAKNCAMYSIMRERGGCIARVKTRCSAAMGDEHDTFCMLHGPSLPSLL